MKTNSAMLDWTLAGLADVPLLAALEKAYIECPWSEENLRQAIGDKSSAIYLLHLRGDVVGYGGVRTVFETAEVYNIAVKEEHRCKGYGTAILQKLKAHAKAQGANELLLEVSERNKAAVALYKKQGFAVLSVRKNYYKSGNALVMRCAL